MEGPIQGHPGVDPVYSLPRAAVTKYRRLVAYTTEMYCLLVLEAGSPKLRCPQAWFLLRAVREALLLASLLGWYTDIFILPRHSSLVGCVQTSPLYKDISHYWIRTTLLTSF